MKGRRGESNPTREELDRYICQNPGVSFKLIQVAFRINHGTLRYHLDHLEKENKIRSVLEKGRKRYFPDYLASFSKNGLGGKELSSTQKRVRTLIGEHPGITRKELLSSLDIGREDLTDVISALKERRLIREVERDGVIGYQMMTRRKLAGEVIAILVEKVIDREMDMDTFRMIKERVDLQLVEIEEDVK